MDKQAETQTVSPVWIVAPENEEGDGWMRGFSLYADGAPEIACITHAQRTGYREAAKADAACQVIDHMAENGSDASEFDAFLYGIESDHEWIRTGC